MSEFGIEISGVSHSYGRKPALKDVSLSVPSGAFWALLGPNGAGKSTLYALLTRLFVAQKGSIRLAGHDLSQNPRAALARTGVVFQQPTLDLDLTVRQNLTYFAGLHGISGRAAQTRMAAVLDRLDMSERAEEKVRSLNGGHRRRMEIARALLHEPDVLLLDEPTVGLDAASRKAITDHVHEMAGDMNITVLWATHLVDEVREDDQLTVLHRGEVLASDKMATVAGGDDLAAVFLRMTGGDDP